MRKPVNKQRRCESRDAAWAAIRRLGKSGAFTVREVCDETRLHITTIRDYIEGLTAAGYLECVGERRTGPTPAGYTLPKEYRLVRDAGVEAPRVRKDGTEVTVGRGREQMWRAMRILKDFSVKDLAVGATTEETPVAETEAHSYINYLHKAGYLALSQPHAPGKAGLARYRFLPSRYSGPKPPMVQRVKQVYDPNLKKVVWSQEVEE